MSRDELIESVEKLREQVKRLAPAEARSLEGIIANLERQIERATDDEDDDGLLENLAQAVGEFEIEHPRLTAALNRVMVTLSNSGL